MPKEKRRKKEPAEWVGFIGIGLDNDGHQRLTTMDGSVLSGGSEQTHEQLVGAVQRLAARLRKPRQPSDPVPPEPTADADQ